MPLVEKRYAQALLELSGEDTEELRQELEGFVDIYSSDKSFSSFLLDPTVKTDNKQTAIKNIFTGRLSKNMLNFVLLLVEKQRIRNMPQIYEQYVTLINERANILQMKVITAVPIEEQQLNSIKEKFKNKYNASAVNATEIVDASIIGGVKVIIGDKVYDGSIKGRLESLTELVTL